MNDRFGNPIDPAVRYALGQLGSRVSLRLKPTGDAIQRAGGYHAVVDAVDRSLDRLAAVIGDAAGMRTLILG